MGFNCTQIFFPDCSKEKALELLNMEETLEEDEYNETSASGSAHQDGFLFWQNFHDGMLDETDYLQISKQQDIITCDVLEGAMVSCIRYWKSGLESWIIKHDSQEGLLDLDYWGSVPKFVSQLKSQQLKIAKEQKDDGVDYMFEVPVLTFQKLANFRYDHENEIKFMALVQMTNKHKKFWQFWK